VFVVVVAGLVVLSLFATGVLNVSKTSAADPTYSRASGSASQAAGQVSGGPWTLVAAVAFDSSTAVSVPVGNLVPSNCSLSGVGSSALPTSLYVPAFSGSLSSGESPWWGMAYLEPSTHEVLLVQVLNGTAEAIGEGSGACVDAFENLTAVPSGAVDSSVAASDAWSGGGMAYVEAHAGLALQQEMALYGGGTFDGLSFGAGWGVDIDPCGVFGTGGLSGSQPTFEAVVNATTGDVLFAGAVATNCTSMGLS
jgi:hypothetical protein